ncbi:MAG: alpha-2-macroglobulin family protein [Ignavibacteria bacterium]|jgi:hypothetical protein
MNFTRIILFLLFLIPAQLIMLQAQTFESEWNLINKELDSGKVRSAESLIKDLFAKANSQEHIPTKLKCILHLSVLTGNSGEPDDRTIIQAIVRYSDSVQTETEMALMNMYLAQSLRNYYHYHLAEIRKRSFEEYPLDDYSSVMYWTESQFLQVISSLINSSLKNPGLLLSIPARSYADLLNVKESSDKYRPTLYDIISHAGIALFESLEQDIADIYRPTCIDPRIFTRANEFMNLDAESIRGYDLSHGMLKQRIALYQSLLRYHASDKDQTAFTDANIQRILGLTAGFDHPFKDSLLISALIAIGNDERVNIATPHALYEAALYCSNNDQNKRAIALCQEIIARFPGSFATEQSIALLGRLQNKALNLTLQKQIIPDKPFLFRTEFTNVDKIFCRIYMLNESIEQQFKQRRYRDQFWDEAGIQALLATQPVQAWKQELPKADDYRDHSTWKKGPPLKKGRYIMVLSNAPVFTQTKDNVVVYSEFTVSPITAILQKEAEGGMHLHIMESVQGTPVKANVQILESIFDQNNKTYSDIIAETFSTNTLGAVFIPPIENEAYIRDRSFRVISQTDTLNIDYPVSRYKIGKPQKRDEIALFTDRSLYRPNQIIQFKGIILDHESDEKAEAISGKRILIRFLDARGKTLDSMYCISNEMGSISGSFTIPEEIVTGHCSLQTDIGALTIKIEEYKRPTFEVLFKQSNSNLKLGENVDVFGLAQSYSGSNLSGSTVRYTIHRSTLSFPFLSYYLYSDPYSRDREIAHGSTIVDASGTFSIQFNAEPDPTISSLESPLYSFRISVDVIAPNGELQRADTSIRVGILNAVYSFEHPGIQFRSKQQDIKLMCIKNNGKPAKDMKGKIIVEAMRNNPLKLTLPFELGDMDGISDKDKELLFPYDQCSREDASNNRSVESIIYSAQHVSDEKGEIIPTLPRLKAGRYRIRFIAESESTPYTIESKWSVIDETSSIMPIDEHLFLHSETQSAAIGDTITYLIGTAWENASVLVQVESKGKIISQERVQLSHSLRSNTLPVLASYRGGISIHCSLIKHGRLITETALIDVPWKEKAIKIQAAVLRNKTRPGSKEEWSFNVIYPSKQHKPEVMGIVYDAALDALYPKQSLSISNLWNRHFPQAQPFALTSGIAFGSAIFGDAWNEAGVKNVGLREFDALNVDLLLGGIFGRTEMMYVQDMIDTRTSMRSAKMVTRYSPSFMDASLVVESESYEDVSAPQKQDITPRISFQETAYFNPFMRLENDIATMKCIMPDGLTRWNIRLFAHDKEMSFGSLDTFVISQKPFMVSTHVPRFVRIGDSMQIRAMIHALEADKTIPVKAYLRYFFDDDSTKMRELQTSATASASAPGLATWSVSIPKSSKLHLIIGAYSDVLNDAESYEVPILPNKQSVTDRYPFWIDGTKQHNASIILESAQDIDAFSYTIATEPFWFAVESLPNLLKPGYGSALDQTYRLLSSQLAQSYVLTNPMLRSALKDSAFQGRLQQNARQFGDVEIGPWEADMMEQADQANNVNVYANEAEMSRIFDHALQALQTMQSSEGGFPWFGQMPSSTFITRQVLSILGICESLQQADARNRDMSYMIGRAIRWLDNEQNKEMNLALKSTSMQGISQLNMADIHYFYVRSFFMKQYPLPTEQWVSTLLDSMWSKRMTFGLQAEAMIALIQFRLGNIQKAEAMLRSLEERSIFDQQGIHWPIQSTSWHDADIETHALLFAAFKEIQSKSEIPNGIITYLLRQKQTRDWSTRSATLHAVMSILKMSERCTGNARNVSVLINDELTTPQYSPFPGVQSYVSPVPADIKQAKISLTGSCPIWGGAFRKRSVELTEQFSTAESEFSVKRDAFRVIFKPEKRIIPIKEGEAIQLGETLLIRIRVNSPLTMNYIHIQDQFPSCFDLMSNNSEYRHYQHLWAYAIPRDSGMNFFIDYLPKGNSMLEYEVKVDKAGIFSKGMVKAYSVFAPEFGVTKGGGKVIITP